MAHFAELDENNTVLRVIVINNAELLDANGVESEAIGIAFCENLFNGRWIQTSYNGTIRKNFAGIDFIYDPVRDAFIAPKPDTATGFDEQTCQWIVPPSDFDADKL